MGGQDARGVIGVVVHNWPGGGSAGWGGFFSCGLWLCGGCLGRIGWVGTEREQSLVLGLPVGLSSGDWA